MTLRKKKVNKIGCGESGYLEASAPVGGTWLPSLSTDEVTVARPLEGVLAVVVVSVGSLSLVVGPPRVVVVAVPSSRAGSSSTFREEGRVGDLRGGRGENAD